MLPLVRLYISWYFYILIIKPRTYNVSIDSSSSTIYENVSFIDHVSGIWLQDGCILAINHKNDNDATIFWHNVIFNCFDVAVFILSSKVTGPSFMSISWLVLELRQFSVIKDWPEIGKSEIPLSEFSQISNLPPRLWLLRYF